jgi:methyl-accepting chemotaxis protein
MLDKLAKAPDKVAAIKETTFFKTIPIIAAMGIASEKGKDSGFILRVPKIQPRNKANEPDEVELQMLKRLEKEKLPELLYVDKKNGFVRFMRPIKLTKDCLLCHGTVADSSNKDGLDPMGVKMEGWKDGEIHGAFELIEHLDKINAAIRQKVLISFILTFIVSVALLFLVVYALHRLVTKPVRDVVTGLRAVADGDLSRDLTCSSHDEIGELTATANVAIINMRAAIGRIVESSNEVALSATGMFSVAEQMATGTEEVAAQTVSLATSTEQMASTSSEIARNCTLAADSSHLAVNRADSGAQVVDQTVTVMNNIAERVEAASKTVVSLGARSEQIGAIVGTIEDIADQTNLLALNAAIEAARAGEQGRGFAVVADEVRALAERTSKATKEIGAMIKAIQNETQSAVGSMEEGVNEVEKGTTEAQRSGAALQEIIEQINTVSMQVSQIATAAEEQTATTQEITNNLQQIKEVVNDTARGTHETAGAASHLADIAEDLKEYVSHFKLG